MGFEWLAAKNYKRHYICLACQKGFKRPSEQDMKHPKSKDFSNLMNEYYASDTSQDIVAYIDAAYERIKVVCPNCQGEMRQVHYDFEVPAQRDAKAWKKLRQSIHPKITPSYNTYIHWHKLELQKAAANSVTFKTLKENLEKLERLRTS